MGRDPVDVAELQRDHEETYGTEMERNQERYEYEQEKADMEYGEPGNWD